ncbi:hypothetical protein BDZ91DRAFT_718065 [Kalaharituber pfeilii]|nr:hypothetical protein BDZ91DRAFT_718065 [Kalaharituber pfeilii]
MQSDDVQVDKKMRQRTLQSCFGLLLHVLSVVPIVSLMTSSRSMSQAWLGKADT